MPTFYLLTHSLSLSVCLSGLSPFPFAGCTLQVWRCVHGCRKWRNGYRGCYSKLSYWFQNEVRPTIAQQVHFCFCYSLSPPSFLSLSPLSLSLLPHNCPHKGIFWPLLFCLFICFYSRIHAVCVCDNSAYFYGHIDQQLQSMGLTRTTTGQPLRAADIIDIIDGYKGRGYSLSTDDELSENVLIHKKY